MKKLKGLLAAALILSMAGCTKAEPEKEAKYTVYNATGETVTELTIVEEGKEATNYAKDGLADGDSVEVIITAPESETKDKQYTLTYVTESGRTAEFTTLSFEEAPITLLAEDAMTGATPIAFSEPMEKAIYTITNKTGEKVTVKLVDNESKEEVFSADLDADATQEATIEKTAAEAKETSYTLSYTTEGGRTDEFTTLSFEQAPIKLLAEDAMSGATPIAFEE